MKMKAIWLASLALSAGLVGCSSNTIAVRAVPGPDTASGSEGSALSKGRMLLERSEYALAADAFRRAIRQNGENADAYNGLAIAYDQLGRFDLSRRYYELALALTPEDARILRNLARSMLRQGNDLAARKTFAEAAVLEADQLRAGPVVSGEGSVTVGIETAGEAHAERPIGLVERALASLGLSGASDAAPSRGGMVSIALDPSALEDNSVGARRNHAELRVVNAVGRKRQAARMRAYLEADGWQAISTGDSRIRYAHSRVMFEPSHGEAARRLAASLPFRPILLRTSHARGVALVLGRDATRFDDGLLARDRS